MVCMKLKNLRLSEDFCGFECAVFDLDGTLLDSMPMWHGVSDKYLESHGISLRSSVWDEVKRLTETQTAVYFQEKFGIKDSLDVICAEFENIIFEEYAKKLQLKDGALRACDRHEQEMRFRVPFASENCGAFHRRSDLP